MDWILAQSNHNLFVFIIIIITTTTTIRFVYR